MNVHNCPLCFSESIRKYELPNIVYQCKSCELLYINDVKYDKDKIQEIDIDDWFDTLIPLRTKNFNIIIEIMNTLNIGKYGLEVGSSKGLFLSMCEKKNIKCIGIEPEKEAYQYSTENNLDVYHGFFPDDLPQKIRLFDFIIYNDVFEHIPDITKTLEASYSFLNKNGYLILNLPLSTGFFYYLSKKMMFFRNNKLLRKLWQLDFYTPHIYYHNIKSIEKICEIYNFELVKSQKLDVISINDFEKRFTMDNNLYKFKFFALPILRLLIPLLKYLNPDVSVFFLRKI